jgi:hypothetical protein
MKVKAKKKRSKRAPAKTTSVSNRGLKREHKAVADTWLTNPGLSNGECYMKHYPKVKNLSVASKCFFQLQKNIEFQNYIAKRRQELSKSVEVDQARVVSEYAKMAFANMADYVNWEDGSIRIRPATQLTREQTAAVSEISFHETIDTSTVRVKLHDKRGSLDSLSRILGYDKGIGRVPEINLTLNLITEKIMQVIDGTTATVDAVVSGGHPAAGKKLQQSRVAAQ